MRNNREIPAAHVAGHAFAAQSFDFEIVKLTINGFQNTDLEQYPNCQRLDEGTLLRTPECHHPPGSFGHTQIHENLCRTALCGPIAELLHQNAEITLTSVRAFATDWQQAWSSAGYLHSDESLRMAYLHREIVRGTIFLSHDQTRDVTVPIRLHLLEHEEMSADEFRSVWERAKAEREREQNRPARRRRPLTDSEEEIARWLEETFTFDVE